MKISSISPAGTADLRMISQLRYSSSGFIEPIPGIPDGSATTRDLPSSEILPDYSQRVYPLGNHVGGRRKNNPVGGRLSGRSPSVFRSGRISFERGIVSIFGRGVLLRGSETGTAGHQSPDLSGLLRREFLLHDQPAEAVYRIETPLNDLLGQGLMPRTYIGKDCSRRHARPLRGGRIRTSQPILSA